MGIRPRVHFFDKDNILKKIPYSKFDRLLNGDKKICYPQFALQRVKCAVSYIEIQNRQPINIVHCDYMIIPFNNSGNLDINEYQHGKMLMFQATGILLSLDNIVKLQDVKAQREFNNAFTWQASQEQIKAIVNQIFYS